MRKLLRGRLRGCRGVRLIAALLLPALGAPAAAGSQESDNPFSIRITSPLGRTGLPGTVRIVARVEAPQGIALPPVRFLVNGEVVGEDTDGPPYVAEWVDENPFERCRLAVEASVQPDHVVRDEVVLDPLEITDTSHVMSVAVDATVVDRDGLPVRGLDASAFRVHENGVPQQVDGVSSTRLPADFALLVDSSESMRPRMEELRHAIQRMLDSVGELDRLVIAPFRQTVIQVTGPTRDAATVADAIAAMQPSGGTAIFDALAEATQRFAAPDRQRIAILLTDGYDEDSGISADAALEHLRASGVTVYVIAVGGIAGVSLKGEKTLRGMAQATGGQAFFPWTEQQLVSACRKIASVVRDRYLLTYTPSDQDRDGRWRAISVSTSDPSHRVMARAGYRAPEPAPVQPTLEFTATNATRQIVELTREDLRVVEDGVPQAVEIFQEATLPVSIVLALDASGSMRRATDTVKAAASSFVRSLRAEDRLALLTFADEAQLVHDLSRMREFSLSKITGYTAAGGTALNDALVDALVRLGQVDGRRAIVLVTDGRDENAASTGPGSIRSWEEVVRLAKAVDAVIYPIGIGSRVDRRRLTELAALSGGEAFLAADAVNLEAEYNRVVEEMRRRYVVGYTSTNARRDGGWRNVEIRSVRPEVQIRSRGGYYAPAR